MRSIKLFFDISKNKIEDGFLTEAFGIWCCWYIIISMQWFIKMIPLCSTATVLLIILSCLKPESIVYSNHYCIECMIYAGFTLHIVNHKIFFLSIW